ncbi:MAG TPA: XRE family transcriptional regulator [Polyangiaceae bacterium]|nr:XRE family transcriptional regulator [Polyangiaceae bacterium]
MSKAKTKPRTKEPSKGVTRPTVKDVEGDELGAAEMARRVAEVLKKLRADRRLSLDELASRSGVSRAALSQIEGARTNPTLAVLWKIAVGLDVPFHDLLGSHDGQPVRVLRASGTAPLKSGDGRMESRLLSPGGASSDVEVYELRFLPKAVHKSDPHGKGTTETLVVLTGALRLVVDGSEYELGTGDSVFFPADVPHAYENRTAREIRCLNVIRYARGG